MTKSNPDENSILQRMQQGDEQALAELFRQHRERLDRLVQFRMDVRVRGRVDAEDVLQESYVAAAQRLSELREKEWSTPFLWLRLVVQQTLMDIHRRHLGAKMRDVQREQPLQIQAQADETANSMAARLASSITSPSNALLRNEAIDHLRVAVNSMDALDREVLALRHFEELTNQEVAQVLNIEQKAASIRYVRALKRLKNLLLEVPGYYDDPTLR